MNNSDFNEYEIALKNLEDARSTLNIEMQEIDEHAELGTNAYSRIINKKQPLQLDELIRIGKKLYNLKAIQILNPTFKIPSIQSLPIEIRKIAKERKGKTTRTQQKRDIIQYCILIINKHVKVGNDFTNSSIKGYFNNELKTTFRGKSIEWSKSVLSSFIEDTGETRKAKTKAEKVYKLIKTIPKDMVTKATTAIGTEWLNELDEKTHRNQI